MRWIAKALAARQKWSHFTSERLTRCFLLNTSTSVCEKASVRSKTLDVALIDII